MNSLLNFTLQYSSYHLSWGHVKYIMTLAAGSKPESRNFYFGQVSSADSGPYAKSKIC